MKDVVKVSEITAVIVRFCPRQELTVAELSGLVVKLMMGAARFEGFWSGETFAPKSKSEREWKLIQRFTTVENAELWSKSPVCQNLFASLDSACEAAEMRIVDDLLKEDDAGVTSVIVTDVKPGMEDAYFAWQAKIQEAQSRFPGFRGLYLQPPTPGHSRQWATLLRFDSPATLEAWFASPERHDLLAESEKFVKSRQIQHHATSYPGWVSVDKATGKAPPNWKTALLVLMGLYPIAVLETRYFLPHLHALPPAMASFVCMVGTVTCTTFITMPLFVKKFAWWLYPGAEEKSGNELKGALLVATIFALELFLLCLR